MKVIVDSRYCGKGKYITLLENIYKYSQHIEKAIRIDQECPAISIEAILDADKWMDIEHKVDLHFYKGKVIAYPINKEDGIYNTDTYTWVEVR
jgi:hypothetical protein